MASPIQDILDSKKDIVIDQLKEILPELDLTLSGCRHDLGLMSFKTNAGTILYAHIVELRNHKTRIVIAPGLSNLKDRDQSEMPESTLKKVLQRLQIELKN